SDFPFFFNHPPSPEIYTLSLHDALPIYCYAIYVVRFACDGRAFSLYSEARSEWAVRSRTHDQCGIEPNAPTCSRAANTGSGTTGDRKSTRLNSSHVKISYAVFCLKKKNK